MESHLLAFLLWKTVIVICNVVYGMYTGKILRPKTRCGPMTGHRQSQGWPPHIGRPISVRRPSHHRSSYSTNCRPNTYSSDQSDLISGWLEAADICLWKRAFRNLNNDMCKIRFCGYRRLFLHKGYSQKNNYEWYIWKLPSNQQWTQWHCNTFQSKNIFLNVLSNHCCSCHSCLFVWIWTSTHDAYTHAMHVLFHYRWLLKFNVLFARVEAKTILWKFPPFKTTVVHRSAQSWNGRVPSIQGCYGRRSVATENCRLVLRVSSRHRWIDNGSSARFNFARDGVMRSIGILWTVTQAPCSPSAHHCNISSIQTWLQIRQCWHDTGHSSCCAFI